MSLVSLSARTYLRYLVPLTLLSVIAYAPLILLALRVPAPTNPAQVKVVLRTTWILAGLGLAPLLVLVGGVAPAVQAIAERRPASQLRVLGAGVVGLGRALVPCAIAIAAIAIGGVALVVPGLVLLVLLALAGAGSTGGVAAALAASVAIARRHVISIVLVLVTTLALVAIATFVMQRSLPIPIPKQPTAAQRAPFRQLARLSVGLFVLAAPLAAVVLAAVRARDQDRRR